MRQKSKFYYIPIAAALLIAVPALTGGIASHLIFKQNEGALREKIISSISAENIQASKAQIPTPTIPIGPGKGCSPGHPHGDVWATRNEHAQGFELKKCWEGRESVVIDYKD